MLLYFLFLLNILLTLNLIRIFPCVSIPRLESNRTDAIVPKREVIAMFDAPGCSIVEMVEFYVVLGVANFEVDCLADD